MTYSRRDFLGLTALSLPGLALVNLVDAHAAKSQAKVPESLRPASRMPLVRRVLSLDQEWEFHRPENGDNASQETPALDAAWESVVLPHSVRLESTDVSGGQNYRGICWYRRSFTAPPEWQNRIVYLKFEAAMQVADIWLNERHLLTHYGGYTPFTLDLSKLLRFDAPNRITVRLNNSDNPEVPPGKPQDELDFVYFGGLYRSVGMEVLDPVHITDPILANSVAGGGLFVSYPEIDSQASTVQIKTELANESAATAQCIVRHRLISAAGDEVTNSAATLVLAPGARADTVQRFRVTEPKLWHPEHPDLYWLYTTVEKDGRILDDQYTRIGIRSIHLDKDQGLLINGEPFFSLGANRHQDHPYVGYALPPSAHYRDAYKLRDAGFTSYRSHYPQDPSFMDACDELGILAIVSNPGWQFFGDEAFQERVYQNAREMIRRDRNHACVAIWEAALNETDNRAVAANLQRIVHEEFPCPGCYTAGDPVHSPVPGFSGWDITYVSYQQKDPSRPSWIREWGDQVDNWTDQQGPVRVARSWGEMPMLVQASTHMLSMDRIYDPATRPAGADLWAGIDAFRGYHHQPFLGAPLDIFRLPKFDYFMFQSQRPPQPLPMRVGSGPMVFIANYGTFFSPQRVLVFSNCEQVRLFQNGKLIATQTPDPGFRIPHPPFTFHVGEFSATRSMLFANPALETERGDAVGELRAEGLIGGNIVATHVVRSPGVPTHIRLELDTPTLVPVANGADWVRVYAHICDARGTTHPLATDPVTFSVSGGGKLIGESTIGANPRHAEAGVATALVCTTRTPGTIVVRAVAPGLTESVLNIESM